MTTYNHAFTIAFSVSGCPDEDGEQTAKNVPVLTAALLERIANVIKPNARGQVELLEAVGVPWDSYEEEDDE